MPGPAVTRRRQCAADSLAPLSTCGPPRSGQVNHHLNWPPIVTKRLTFAAPIQRRIRLCNFGSWISSLDGVLPHLDGLYRASTSFPAKRKVASEWKFPVKRALAPLLFRNHPGHGGRWCRRGRNDKRQPGIPAGRASRVTKFSVTLDINVTLKALAERKHVAELRSDAKHLRLETSDAVA